MSRPYLSIGRLERRLHNGEVESINLVPGVNLLVGPPNTGKTKWLSTFDYLMGDPDPIEDRFEEHMVEKYDSAAVELIFGDDRAIVERRWKEPRNKGKVFVNDTELLPREFQQFLLEWLHIPQLNFPRGNPMSGQTWPLLSWRMLLRHVYRQQRFWSGLVDKQLDDEQLACLLQFLGVAELIYTEDYGRLVDLRLRVERLKARREQFSSTLDALGRDIHPDGEGFVSVTATTIRDLEQRLAADLQQLRLKREALIKDGRDVAVPTGERGRVSALSGERAEIIVRREELDRRLSVTGERLEEMKRYAGELSAEAERLNRADDASAALADLRITHCPACDQPVAPPGPDDSHCHLCHKHLVDGPVMRELGATRLRYEADRIKGELDEAKELVSVLEREMARQGEEHQLLGERLQKIENELTPARQAVSALVSEELSAVDMAMGELNERQRQVARLKAALQEGDQLTRQIDELEREIAPLNERVGEKRRSIDLAKAEQALEDGMNDYLTKIHQIRPDVWRHGAVKVEITNSKFSIKVGTRRYSAALGGTDTLYFLMAYQYGLLTLSGRSECHYPGLSIIDLPGDFLGESVEDKENFIVQPFIDLLKEDTYRGAQVIITGASFLGLGDVNRVHLNSVFAAR